MKTIDDLYDKFVFLFFFFFFYFIFAKEKYVSITNCCIKDRKEKKKKKFGNSSISTFIVFGRSLWKMGVSYQGERTLPFGVGRNLAD